MKNYDEATVRKQLKNKGIKVDISSGGLRTLLVPKDDPNIGIRTWGKIDYLCHYRSYHWMWQETK